MGALCCKPEVNASVRWLQAQHAEPLITSQQIDFDAPVDLWHFYLLRSVGKGAFGKASGYRSIDLQNCKGKVGSDACKQVRVVQHKQTKALYALKYINKQVSWVQLISYQTARLGLFKMCTRPALPVQTMKTQLNANAKPPLFPYAPFLRYQSRRHSDASSNTQYRISSKSDAYWKRSNVPSCATCATLSKMTRIYSWYWTSCLAETSAFT